MKRQLVALLCLAAASSLYADGEALATSAEFASPLDTLVAMRAVAAVDGLTGLVYRVGETITVTSRRNGCGRVCFLPRWHSNDFWLGAAQRSNRCPAK